MGDDESRARGRDRAVIRGAVATSGTRLVTTATSFIILAIAARTLTTDEFGWVTMLISIWLILTMFDFGLGGALLTRIAASHARDDAAEVWAHFKHALLAMTAIGGLIAVGGCILAATLPWHAWINGALSAATLDRGMAIALTLSGASLPAAVGAVTLAGRQQFTAATGSVAAGGVLGAVACAVVAPMNPPPEVFLLAVLGGPVAMSSALTAWVGIDILRAQAGPSRFQAARLTDMLRASGWYALYTTANTITLGTGTVIVGTVVGLGEAAVFNVASRLFSPILTVIAASGALLWPGMTEAITRGELAWVRSRYQRGVLAIAGVGSVLSLALVAIGPWLAELWVGAALVPSRSLFLWTAAFTVTLAVTSQASVLLMAVERLRAAAVYAVVAALVSGVTSVLLANSLGAEGAAIGALAGCLCVLLPGIALLARDTLRSLGSDAGSHTGRVG